MSLTVSCQIINRHLTQPFHLGVGVGIICYSRKSFELLRKLEVGSVRHSGYEAFKVVRGS